MENSAIQDLTAIEWLLEDTPPGVRYLALRDLLDRPADDPELLSARKIAHEQGPISHVLAHMDEQGYWEKPGAGYGPKYRSTVWAITLLAQLGADIGADSRVEKACQYLVEHALTPNGQFSCNGTPSYNIECLQGNLCWALTEMGYEGPRLDGAYDWMARSLTGEGVAPREDKNATLRYYAYNCGPGFQCGANLALPCAWGGAKVMLAFSVLSPEKRTPLIARAIQQGVNFLFSVDLTSANWPSPQGIPPSRDWWLFGFPVFYITDLLQVAEALAGLGYGQDERMVPLLDLIRQKRNQQGQWLLEYDYKGKTWGNYGAKKQPNKWVTLRALRTLKLAGNPA